MWKREVRERRKRCFGSKKSAFIVVADNFSSPPFFNVPPQMLEDRRRHNAAETASLWLRAGKTENGETEM